MEEALDLSFDRLLMMMILLRLLFPHVKLSSLQNNGLLNVPNHSTLFLTASYYTIPLLPGFQVFMCNI